MKVVILAGGLGTRLSEETGLRPKPMVEIGGLPILWHIMKHYSFYGFNDFVILVGYKGEMIKKYFADYYMLHSDVTFDLAKNSMKIHQTQSEKWKVTVVDTGLETLTGSRLKFAQKYLKDEAFLLTYGDGVSNVNINKLIEFHKKNQKIMTLTAIQPEGRFGRLSIEGNFVKSFEEKPKGDGGWINGGFFVCEPEIFKYLNQKNNVMLEREPMKKLAKDNQISCFKHEKFWKAMDTLRDRNDLENMWKTKKAPWKLWK